MTWIAWVKNSQITSNCGVDNVFDDYLLDCYLNYLIQINDHGFTDYCKWLAPCNLPVSKGQSRCSALPLAGQPEWLSRSVTMALRLTGRPLAAWACAAATGLGHGPAARPRASQSRDGHGHGTSHWHAMICWMNLYERAQFFSIWVSAQKYPGSVVTDQWPHRPSVAGRHRRARIDYITTLHCRRVMKSCCSLKGRLRLCGQCYGHTTMKTVWNFLFNKTGWIKIR